MSARCGAMELTTLRALCAVALVVTSADALGTQRDDERPQPESCEFTTTRLAVTPSKPISDSQRLSEMRWPLAPGCLQRVGSTYLPNFGDKRKRGDGTTRRHRGIDLIPPLDDDKVYAAANGKVRRVGSGHRDFGNFIELVHGPYRVIYAHLKAPPAFRVSQQIGAGEIVGTAWCTGTVYVHLHLQVFGPGGAEWTGGTVDPESLLGH